MIGDLLAQITGEADPKAAPPASLPKRKAVSDLPRSQAAKVPRGAAAAPPILKTGNGVRAHTLETPRTPALQSKTSSLSQPYRSTAGLSVTSEGPNSASAVRRTIATPSSRSALPPAKSSQPVARNKTGSGNTDTSKPAVLKSAPKKGSYLEIMERAKAAQSGLNQLGKIQHKPLDKVPSKRDRMAAQAEETSRVSAAKRGPGMTPQKGATSRTGMAQRLPLGKTPVRDSGSSGSATKGGGPAPVNSGRAAAAARQRPGIAASKHQKEEEKRPKKAATATTGYQGTARPRPTSSTSAAGPPGGSGDGRSGDSRSGVGNARHHSSTRRMPFSNPRRSRYDEDDEMDDFIEYDDEEEEEVEAGGRRNSYYSRRGHYDDDDDEEEDESDMEAGLSDIDDEERLADRAARREDAEQEALERRLKMEKEERKRRLMGSSRR
ncbi:hypothetical protein SEPCBS119000_004400 [Sporothrix epigloea]|uniref:Chromatin spt2 protein n=1 Tax=Sporothrix epigloea TaxID=1892477 RepID=A0ABP0DT41_9PEZI